MDSRSDIKSYIGHLYHFTDAGNLQSIGRTGGILSARELSSRSIEPVARGGNELSRRIVSQRGLDDYVHLCLFENHPMAYRAVEDGRISNLQYLRIDRAVLDVPGVLVAPDVSTKSGVPLVPLGGARTAANWECLGIELRPQYEQDREILGGLERVEILVPHMVSIHLIEDVDWLPVFSE